MTNYYRHLIAGLVTALVVALPVYLDQCSLFSGLWACLAGIIAGGIKEWCDTVYGNRWDWKDFGYTAIGVAIAVVFVLMLHFGRG